MIAAETRKYYNEIYSKLSNPSTADKEEMYREIKLNHNNKDLTREQITQVLRTLKRKPRDQRGQAPLTVEQRTKYAATIEQQRTKDLAKARQKTQDSLNAAAAATKTIDLGTPLSEDSAIRSAKRQMRKVMKQLPPPSEIRDGYVGKCNGSRRNLRPQESMAFRGHDHFMLIGCTDEKGYLHPTTASNMEIGFIAAFNEKGDIELLNADRGGGGGIGLRGIRDTSQPKKRQRSSDGTFKHPMTFVHDPENYRTYFTWAELEVPKKVVKAKKAVRPAVRKRKR
jgi:hypothetical protein